MHAKDGDGAREEERGKTHTKASAKLDEKKGNSQKHGNNICRGEGQRGTGNAKNNTYVTPQAGLEPTLQAGIY